MKKIVLAIALVSLFLNLSCKKTNNEDSNTQFIENVNDSYQNNDIQDVDVNQHTNTPTTNITLTEHNFDFGNIKKGEIVQHTYEIINTGENPLIISNVVPGCGCTASEYTKEPIMPKEKAKITLKFDSSNFDGTQHKQAQVYANVDKVPFLITFTANVINH